MKNAIIPTLVLASGTLFLAWQEIETYNQSPVTRKVEIVAADGDSIDLTVEKQNSSDFNQIDNQTETVLKKLAGLHRSLEQLVQDPQFLELAEFQKFYTKKLLLKSLLRKDPKSAISIGEKLIQSSNHDASILFNTALAYRKEGEIDKAIYYYNKLISNFPEHQAGMINLGMLYKKQKQWSKAEEILTLAIEISNGKKKAKAYSLLGSVYQKQTQYEQAMKNFRKSIQYRPGHVSTWLFLAETMRGLERPYQEVFTTYKRASKLAPSNYRILRKLGQYQLENLEFLDAKRSFSRALELAPHSIDANRGLAWTYTEMGSYDDALKSWQWLEKNEKSQSHSNFAHFAKNTMEHIIQLIEGSNAIELPTYSPPPNVQDDFEQMNLVLLEVSSRTGIESNISCIDPLEELSTMSSRSLYKGAKCALNQKNTVNAAKLLAVLQRKMSNSNEVRILLGRNLSQQGKFGEAESQYLQAISVAPDRLDLIVERVKNLIAAGEYKKAKQVLSSTSKKHSSKLALAELSGELAWHSMDWSKSLARYQELSDWEPKVTRYRYRHAYAAIKLKKYALAKTSLREILSIDAANISARVLLAETHCNTGEYKACKTEALKILKLDRNNQSALRLTKL